MHLSVLQFLPLPKRVPARKPVWASCNSISLQISCRQHQGFEYHVILSSSKPRMIVDVSIIVFEHHAILLPYSAAALFRCLRTLQFHTFSILKSIGTSKKSGLNPCNFTSAKPTVQHSENLFEFENHVISSSSKPNSGVFSNCWCLSTMQFYLLPNWLISLSSCTSCLSIM